MGGIFATIVVYLVLSYAYKLTDTLDHFKLLDFQIEASGNPEKVLSDIEDILTKYDVDIKHLKKSDSSEDGNETFSVKLVVQYNKKFLNKNELVKDISLVENVIEINEI